MATESESGPDPAVRLSDSPAGDRFAPRESTRRAPQVEDGACRGGFPVPVMGTRMRCSCGGRDIETRPNRPDNLGVVTRPADAGACA